MPMLLEEKQSPQPSAGKGNLLPLTPSSGGGGGGGMGFWV